MLNSSEEPVEKPLASWKVWWGPDVPLKVADSLVEHINPKKLPGGGRLLSTDHFTGEVVKDPHVASVAEALLLAYPPNRQPSSYLLGDAVIQLDLRWKGSLLGGHQSSPVKEKLRRDDALAEGGKLKKLISYMRTSALKAENGKTPKVTYLKTLANNRDVKIRRTSSASTTSSSPRSFYSGTTLELGQLVFKEKTPQTFDAGFGNDFQVVSQKLDLIYLCAFQHMSWIVFQMFPKGSGCFPTSFSSGISPKVFWVIGRVHSLAYLHSMKPFFTSLESKAKDDVGFKHLRGNDGAPGVSELHASVG